MFPWIASVDFPWILIHVTIGGPWILGFSVFHWKFICRWGIRTSQARSASESAPDTVQTPFRLEIIGSASRTDIARDLQNNMFSVLWKNLDTSRVFVFFRKIPYRRDFLKKVNEFEKTRAGMNPISRISLSKSMIILYLFCSACVLCDAKHGRYLVWKRVCWWIEWHRRFRFRWQKQPLFLTFVWSFNSRQVENSSKIWKLKNPKSTGHR